MATMTEMTDRPIMESNQALQAALELSMLNLNNTTYSTASPDPPFGLFDEQPLLGNKKSQNVTQCVAVPSSEHVAEIVGRQGCKIKALRAKTNTYIKTPVRGEEPIFIITGRPEDVAAAKREILGAAEHFTQIRAARRCNSTSSPSFGGPTGSPAEENKLTIYVRVPYRVVGLVVGPKGATVKRIQQITNTYIVTPSRDKEPSFEVTGTPENVDRARKEIESYIAMRTGGSIDSDYESDYQSLLSPAVDSVFSPTSQLNRRTSDVSNKMFHFPSITRASASPPDFSPPTGYDSCPWAEKSIRNSPLSSAVFGASNDAGIDYPSYALPQSAPVTTSEHVFDFTGMQEALMAFKPHPPSPTDSYESNSSEGTAVTSPKQSPKLPQRHLAGGSLCYMCREREVVAALVPCGHNLFCYSCAQHTTHCPLCSTQVSTFLRIYTS